jgi:adenylate cyclase class 2
MHLLIKIASNIRIMLEVEVRARVKSFRGIREALNDKARFMGSAHQTDFVFGHPNFLDSEHKIKEGGIIARIREEGLRKRLEFKEIKRQGAAIELKHEVTSTEAARDFLSKLGFLEAFAIKKSRESYLFRDFLVCLDSVEELGQFIEVERMVSSEQEAGEARKQCLEVLKEFAPDAETEYRKYGDMMQDLINKGEHI